MGYRFLNLKWHGLNGPVQSSPSSVQDLFQLFLSRLGQGERVERFAVFAQLLPRFEA